jgi:uncharacterized protein (TIGR03083 family)
MQPLRRATQIRVVELFQPDRDALLYLLASLSRSDWELPTVCTGWTVKDVAVHLLGGDLGLLAMHRDGASGVPPREAERLGDFVNRINAEWVEAGRRLSPRLVHELLGWSGRPLFEHFSGLDPDALGSPVSWAGPEPAPVWLGIAREYTERWVHQQHIRDAVGRPGQTDPRFLGPVIATFMHAFPAALQAAERPVRTTVAVSVGGPAGGDWAVVREPAGWGLREGLPPAPEAALGMDSETAWRLLTLGLPEAEASSRVVSTGDQALAGRALRAVAIIS